MENNHMRNVFYDIWFECFFRSILMTKTPQFVNLRGSGLHHFTISLPLAVLGAEI